MYDIIRFALGLNQLFADTLKPIIHTITPSVLKQNLDLLTKMVTISTKILNQIYIVPPKLPFDHINTPYGGIDWLIHQLFRDEIKVHKNKSSEIKNSVQIVKMQSSVSEQPGFISARRKYADELKKEYLSKYLAKMLL